MTFPSLTSHLPASSRLRAQLAYLYGLVLPLLANWAWCLLLLSRNQVFDPVGPEQSFWAKLAHGSGFLAVVLALGLVLPGVFAILARRMVRHKAALHIWQRIGPTVEQQLPEQLEQVFQRIPEKDWKTAKGRAAYREGIQDLLAHRAFAQPGGQILMRYLSQHPAWLKTLRKALSQGGERQQLAFELTRQLTEQTHRLLRFPLFIFWLLVLSDLILIGFSYFWYL